MSKLVYRLFALAASVLGGVLATALFQRMWKWVSDEGEPPKAKAPQYSWREVLPAAALEGAVFGFVKAAVDRSSLRAFQKLTGQWAGE